ncbi:uncharacterized protein MELLADRAFT_108186 [Melampsora larici-populina 98AG31]|uniref:FAR1 domain-containing protein n=1 Tax=Melampsora larici-populina (strain 98AG31 / pathotype 3-4-7) TaxID=747676 RepID=F4RS96_MELLP|nr:uncharacterized protein MELLADRAFT_108186 [Melampsora larici-populina 98AG31]EGG04561.1 hypothetical protein MELLADRAFT_108186 [Melampsora larici-populina 98AG31]
MSTINNDNIPDIDMPAPPEICLPGTRDPLDPKTREHMDRYVKSFAAPHGYLISVGKSYVSKGRCTYRCHRGGFCKTSNDTAKTSKSLKIQCPFELKAKLDTEHRYWTLSHINTSHNHPPNFELEYIPPDDKNSTGVDIDTFLYSLSQRLQLLDSTTQMTIVEEINHILDKPHSTHASVIRPSSSKKIAESQDTNTTILLNLAKVDTLHEQSHVAQKTHSVPHENINVEILQPSFPVDHSTKTHTTATNSAPTSVLNNTHETDDGTPSVPPLPPISSGPSVLHIQPPSTRPDQAEPSGTSVLNIQAPPTGTDNTKVTHNNHKVSHNTKKNTSSTNTCSSVNERPRTRKQLREQVPECSKPITRTNKSKR